MFHAIFDMGISVGEKLLRALLVYCFLLFALRVLGKRELAQQDTLDFLVLLLVANAVQNGIIGNDNSVTGAVVGAAALFGINYTFKALAYRYPWADRAFEGSPSYLIRDGQIVHSTMRREQISKPELRAIARRQGYESLDDDRHRDPRDRRQRHVRARGRALRPDGAPRHAGAPGGPATAARPGRLRSRRAPRRR